ncbi:hypothetical protein Pint_19507 [Pistacia integerrima]|uniref:Uncharacterized protein n=1 Tax=Pistacia integerrima TaxID=434235 RepID=A0ACC0YUU4_9ROSI|nr:hypothetical protein Pint_19507 [Pistacia integerrima]
MFSSLIMGCMTKVVMEMVIPQTLIPLSLFGEQVLIIPSHYLEQIILIVVFVLSMNMHMTLPTPKEWGLDGFERVDVNQADIAPIMSTLVGLPCPVNSVGNLRPEYINMNENMKRDYEAAMKLSENLRSSVLQGLHYFQTYVCNYSWLYWLDGLSSSPFAAILYFHARKYTKKVSSSNEEEFLFGKAPAPPLVKSEDTYCYSTASPPNA